VVKVSNKDGRMAGTGFHVRIKNKVYIVTNKHVCESVGTNKNVFIHKSGKLQSRKIIKMSKKSDLCLIEPTLDRGLILGNPKEKEETYFSVGHPAAQNLRLTKLIYIYDKVSTVCGHRTGENCRTLNSQWYIGYIYGGSSGSPIINKIGRVVGVVFASRSDGYALGASVKELLHFINNE
jgi:hypothetical protein